MRPYRAIEPAFSALCDAFAFLWLSLIGATCPQKDAKANEWPCNGKPDEGPS
jgi:hypothetical protein